jgi:retron-type reverse transcriptase
MKRIGNLKASWCNYEALHKAFYEVKKNKSYYHSIIEFESNLVCNLNRILISLEDGTYKVKPTRDFYITDPKVRLIQAPQFEDRIVQHAVLNSIRETVENKFIDQTFACIKGRGTHGASDLLKRYLVNYKNEGYYLKVDIKKFFYTINHKVLDYQLSRIIKCKPTLELLKKFYKDGTGKGLPLGNVTSQLFANLALNPIDHLLKRVLKCKHAIRYMDDIIILSKSKAILRHILDSIEKLLIKLKLKTNEKTQIGLILDGIDFVGYRTWFNNRLIRKRSLYKIKRVLKKHPDINRIASYLAHSKRTNSLIYVLMQMVKVIDPLLLEFVKTWLIKNKEKGEYHAIFQS